MSITEIEKGKFDVAFILKMKLIQWRPSQWDFYTICQLQLLQKVKNNYHYYYRPVLFEFRELYYNGNIEKPPKWILLCSVAFHLVNDKP